MYQWWVGVQLLTDQFLAGQNFPQLTQEFPANILVLSKVTDSWWIENFDLSRFSTTVSELSIKRMNFEKNVRI